MYKILVLAHDLEVGADARISQESARLPHWICTAYCIWSVISSISNLNR
jgi:hypothetical protein